MGLIDREAAKSKKVYSNERHEYVVPVAEIDWLPAAEATEIVRCKSCAFAKPVKLFQRDMCFCERWAKQEEMAETAYYSVFVHYPTDYCSAGRVRRGEGGQN